MGPINAIIEMFHSGGFVMWPLLICSLATWAIVFERLWSHRNLSADSHDLVQNVEKLLLEGHKEKALEFCIRSDLPLARIMEDAIRRGTDKNETADTMAKRINRGRVDLSQNYRRYLWILGTIGSACPFLGLFGTVVGILRAFKHIAETGDTGFSVVAGEISAALVATAAGIIVAVVAVAFYNFLQVKAANLSTESKQNLESFFDSWLKAYQRMS